MVVALNGDVGGSVPPFEGGAMYFRVLGSVRVEVRASKLGLLLPPADHACELPISGQRKQVIIAMLALNVGQTVSVSRIIDAIWVDVPPPATAREQVQNCTAELRRALSAARCDGHRPADCLARIVTVQDGYRLEAGNGMVDAIWFGEVVRQCSSAVASMPDGEVCDRLREALDLWSGAAVGGLPSTELQAEAVRLEELKLVAIEELAARELRTGGSPAWHVATLLSLIRRHPYRERLRLLHMEALRMSGRAVEALAQYREYRTTLVADHGVEPGPELRTKEREILQSIA